MTRSAARLAIAFAIFLAIAEVVRNWGDWGYWPFWVVDYIAVFLLLFGARQALRPPPRQNLVPLGGAWGFTCAMFYGSFFSHIQHINEPDHGPIAQMQLTITIGILFAITIAGFLMSLLARRERS